MIQATFPDDVVVNQYDVNGELSFTKNSISQISFTRDSRKRVIQVDVEGLGVMGNYPQHSLAYSYDKNDNKVAMQSSVGSISYQVDALSRVTGMSNSWGDSFAFNYDDASRLVKSITVSKGESCLWKSTPPSSIGTKMCV